ncbi:ribosomal protein S13 [Candidatus Carsonella ruddii HT isolate Thao2000]|uniref:Small ribosomal subunit protein uS13 n=1 Tax=Candidatus Carsonella ruddii HT isolate Thao2000 TaxID=1202539 RepID=J3TWD4_CARRU|nr:30S ribosomal protein S13 [Candidatus Carsonella ruddii]AFP84185.1 ribosomal protein S13 [Candidatus Carsonella ruddii HT isolate Thao2000]
MNYSICGVKISEKKNILFGLTKIYGIGIKLSNKICKKLKIDVKKKVFNLSNIEFELLNNFIKKIIIENDLKLLIKENLKRILNLNSYKSYRHKKKLPCRGQRTKTNAKTRKKMNHEKI